MRGAERSVPLTVDVYDLATDILFLDELLKCVAIAWVTTALVANLAELARAVHCRDHATRPFKGVRHHLFTIHITTSFEGHNGVRCVPKVRCGDEDRIEIFLLKHFFDVKVAVDVGAKARFDRRKCTANAGLHNVGCCNVANAGNIDHRIEQYFVLLAAPNEAHANVVCRRTSFVCA